MKIFTKPYQLLTFLPIVALLLATSLASTRASALEKWKPECAPGHGALKSAGADLYYCKKPNGTRTLYKRATCAPQTPNLVKKPLNGYNYSCELNTKIVGGTKK